MRKLVVTEELTLDGIIENPTWSATYWNDDIAAFKSQEMQASDTLLLGRATYEELGAFWSVSKDEGADEMNRILKYVVSTTLQKADWNNSRLIKDDVVSEIRALKQQDGKDILVYGSANLIQTLIQHDLIDRYHLLVYPVVVGKGKRLFKEGTATTLRLVESRSLGGVVAMVYEPERQ